MSLHLIARFHARPGAAVALEEALRTTRAASSAEPGCAGFLVVRGLRDPDLFFIHSQWLDEAAFDLHATLAHTLTFLATMEALVDQPPEITRTAALG